MTNLEKIKNMSEEQLYWFIDGIIYNVKECNPDSCEECNVNKMCNDKNWLRSEYDER